MNAKELEKLANSPAAKWAFKELLRYLVAEQKFGILMKPNEDLSAIEFVELELGSAVLAPDENTFYCSLQEQIFNPENV